MPSPPSNRLRVLGTNRAWLFHDGSTGRDDFLVEDRHVGALEQDNQNGARNNAADMAGPGHLLVATR